MKLEQETNFKVFLFQQQQQARTNLEQYAQEILLQLLKQQHVCCFGGDPRQYIGIIIPELRQVRNYDPCDYGARNSSIYFSFGLTNYKAHFRGNGPYSKIIIQQKTLLFFLGKQ